MFMPRDFAHDLVAMEDKTMFHYKVDNYNSSENECGVLWNDEWPDIFRLKIIF